MSTKNKKTTKKDEESKEESKEEVQEKKSSPKKKSATASPKKKAPKKKPEHKKSDYKCAICDEPYKAGTKHWKSKSKSGTRSSIPGISISQNIYNITKDLNNKYGSKDEIPKTSRLCLVCYKEKVYPQLPKRSKETKETKEKDTKSNK